MEIDVDYGGPAKRFQHIELLAMLVVSFFVYSLVVQYTLVLERGVWRYENFTDYRNRNLFLLTPDILFENKSLMVGRGNSSSSSIFT